MKEQWAVVTGASSGIGTEIAIQLSKKGYNILAIARREDRLKKLQEKITMTQYEYLTLDLTQSKAAQTIFSQTKNKNINILINNAGAGKSAPFTDISWEEHLRLIQLNSLFPTEAMGLFIPYMKSKQDASYILNIASLAAFFPLEALSIYSGTKSFLKNVSQAISLELKGSNISVTCSCPGGVLTEFSEQAGFSVNPSAQKMMRTAEDIAAQSLKAMFNKKDLIVPGIENQLTVILKKILPDSFANYLFNKSYRSIIGDS